MHICFQQEAMQNDMKRIHSHAITPVMNVIAEALVQMWLFLSCLRWRMKAEYTGGESKQDEGY